MTDPRSRAALSLREVRLLLASAPVRFRDRITFQSPSRASDSPAWLLRVQRYRCLAQWRFPFGSASAAISASADVRQALAAASAKAREIERVLDEYRFPHRNRAPLVARNMPRPRFPHVPRGIEPRLARDGTTIRAYAVRWKDDDGFHGKTFRLADGATLCDARAFRNAIESHALEVDQQRQALFRRVMVELGANLSELP